MALTSLLIGKDQRTTFKDSTGNADLLVIDVTKTITPKYSATVTDHPVEEGRGISDHIRPNNIEMTLEGYVSESPLSLDASLTGMATSVVGKAGNLVGGNAFGSGLAAAGGLGANHFISAQNKATATRDFLISLIESKRTFRMAAPSLSKKYNDAIYTMTNVSFPSDSSTGKGMAFSATIKQIRVVSSLSVPIGKLANAHSSSQVANAGKQAAKEADEGKRKSFLKAFGGFFSK